MPSTAAVDNRDPVNCSSLLPHWHLGSPVSRGWAKITADYIYPRDKSCFWSGSYQVDSQLTHESLLFPRFRKGPRHNESLIKCQSNNFLESHACLTLSFFFFNLEENQVGATNHLWASVGAHYQSSESVTQASSSPQLHLAPCALAKEDSCSCGLVVTQSQEVPPRRLCHQMNRKRTFLLQSH